MDPGADNLQRELSRLMRLMGSLQYVGRVVNAARSPRVVIPVAILAVAGTIFAVIASLPLASQEELLYLVQDFLPIVMFLSLAVLLFSGFPVAFILGGLALLYGMIGYLLGTFSLIEFFNFLPRIWGTAAENLVLVAVPAFVFMGVMMERSGRFFHKKCSFSKHNIYLLLQKLSMKTWFIKF